MRILNNPPLLTNTLSSIRVGDNHGTPSAHILLLSTFLSAFRRDIYANTLSHPVTSETKMICCLEQIVIHYGILTAFLGQQSLQSHVLRKYLNHAEVFCYQLSHSLRNTKFLSAFSLLLIT